jgi:hypothetical protein
MDFRTHRPQRGFGRSERSLAKIAEELTRFLTKAQRSLTYDTLHLPSRKRETLASLLVECAEDLSHDIGIWRSLEHYNSDFFGHHSLVCSNQAKRWTPSRSILSACSTSSGPSMPNWNLD